MIYQIDYCMLKITNRCEHNCPICYAESSSGEQEKDVELQQLTSIVDKLYEAKIANILLLGGDPSLYAPLKDLVIYIDKLGIKTKIQSNSMNFLEFSRAEIAKYFYALETTIHGSDEVSHDSFCNFPGAYNSIVNRLRYYKGAGIDIGIAINLMPSTFQHVFGIIYSLVKKGLSPNYVYIQRIVPIGRVSKNAFALYSLTKNMVMTAAFGLQRIKTELGINVYYEDAFPFCTCPEYFADTLSPCRCGYNWACVDYSGNVTRCPTDTKHVIGNVLARPLLDIWNTSVPLTQYREKNFLPVKCQECGILELCGGGCSISCDPASYYNADYLIDL